MSGKEVMDAWRDSRALIPCVQPTEDPTIRRLEIENRRLKRRCEHLVAALQKARRRNFNSGMAAKER